MTASHQVRRALQVCEQDLRWLPREFWVNVLAAATVTPRLLRRWMYRVAGIETASHNISARCTFTGPGPIRIGRGTFVNLGCTFDAAAPITVGEHCAIAPEVLICTSTHDRAADGSFGPPVGRPVVIGDRCWLGARVTVLPGVVIGDDVQIAAGAVVVKDCPAGGRYRGVPAEPF